MQRIRWISTLLAIPAMAVLVASAGCGGGDTEKPKGGGASSTTGGATVTSGGESKKAASSAKQELASTGSGTIKGHVLYDGDPPKPAQLKMEKDTDHCMKGPKSDTTDPAWRVGGNKGVGNVVVWLQAPKSTYFKIPDAEKERKDTVLVQQPFCAFEPHVFAVYPSYYDPKAGKQTRTGQGFKVTNTAPIPHNTNLTFSDPLVNNMGGNNLIPAKSGDKVNELKFEVWPCKEKDFGKVQEVKFTCNVHAWMYAYGKIFDHPYFAVTTGGKDDDKDPGTFEIKNAPAGAEVELVYWHESMKGPKVVKKITLKDGETLTEDIKIKKE